MYKAKEISNGYKNLLRSKFGLTSEKEEKLFEARRTICNNCEHGQTMRCKLCGCPIAAKTKSIESKCPDNLW